MGDYYRVIRWDTRGLDYSSYHLRPSSRSFLFARCRAAKRMVCKNLHIEVCSGVYRVSLHITTPAIQWMKSEMSEARLEAHNFDMIRHEILSMLCRAHVVAALSMQFQREPIKPEPSTPEAREPRCPSLRPSPLNPRS